MVVAGKTLQVWLWLSELLFCAVWLGLTSVEADIPSTTMDPARSSTSICLMVANLMAYYIEVPIGRSIKWRKKGCATFV